MIDQKVYYLNEFLNRDWSYEDLKLLVCNEENPRIVKELAVVRMFSILMLRVLEVELRGRRLFGGLWELCGEEILEQLQ